MLLDFVCHLCLFTSICVLSNRISRMKIVFHVCLYICLWSKEQNLKNYHLSSHTHYHSLPLVMAWKLTAQHQTYSRLNAGLNARKAQIVIWIPSGGGILFPCKETSTHTHTHNDPHSASYTVCQNMALHLYRQQQHFPYLSSPLLFLLGISVTTFTRCGGGLDEVGYSFDDGREVLLYDPLVLQARQQHQKQNWKSWKLHVSWCLIWF